MITNHDFDISFCIPTYNFGRFIGETLDSIIRQADDRVQIVIVDGGSTDETAQVVNDRARGFPHIKFIQRRERSGVDRDILESVVQADGRFCWLFSSDDVLAPGALEFVRGQMQENGWDVLLTNFAICDRNLNRLFRHRVLDIAALSTFDWNDPADRDRYFTRAQTTTAFFSFISAVVVRRSTWLSVPPQTDFVGSCWVIAAQMFAIARRRLVVRYYPGELLFQRGNNDSFLSSGLLHRLALSITGFPCLAEHYFGAASSAARHVRRVVRNEFSLPTMLRYKVEVDSQKNGAQSRAFVDLFKGHFSGDRRLDALRRCTVHAPAALLRGLFSVHRQLRAARHVLGER